MVFVFVLLAALMVPYTSARAEIGDKITGKVTTIKDGDSLLFGDKEFRLFGIDAFEKNQTCTKNGVETHCGAQATATLARLAHRKTVTCEDMGDAKHGRRLGFCTVGGVDLSREMVRSGNALVFREYTDRYEPRTRNAEMAALLQADESAAKAEKRGAWAGEFIDPWQFRDNGFSNFSRSTGSSTGASSGAHHSHAHRHHTHAPARTGKPCGGSYISSSKVCHVQ